MLYLILILIGVSSRLKFLVRKWRRATRAGSREIMGSTASPPTSSQTEPHPQRTTTQTHTSTSPATASAIPGLSPLSMQENVSRRYTSPLRTSPRIGEYVGDSPPVRDRGAYGMVNGMAHSGTHAGQAQGRTRPFSTSHTQR